MWAVKALAVAVVAAYVVLTPNKVQAKTTTTGDKGDVTTTAQPPAAVSKRDLSASVKFVTSDRQKRELQEEEEIEINSEHLGKRSYRVIRSDEFNLENVKVTLGSKRSTVGLQESLSRVQFFSTADEEASFAVRETEEGNHHFSGGFKDGGKSYSVYPSSRDLEHVVREDANDYVTGYEDAMTAEDIKSQIKQNSEKREASEPEVVDGKTVYYVDIKYVIDWYDVQWYASYFNGNITRGVEQAVVSVGSIFNEMRRHYSHIKDDFDIDIKLLLLGMHVCDSADACEWVNKATILPTPTQGCAVNFSTVARTFREFAYYEGHNDFWGNPDITMLYTGCGVSTHAGTRVGGVAWLSQVCNGGMGFNLDADYGFSAYYIGSHELAHNLGSPHDSGYCVGFMGNGGGYQMSNCSVDSFKRVFNGRECVNKPRCQSKTLLTITDQYLQGECTRKYGPEFKYDAGQICNPDKVCDRGYCVWNNETYRDCRNPPDKDNADGVPCGGGKICLDRKCVAPPASDQADQSNCVEN